MGLLRPLERLKRVALRSPSDDGFFFDAAAKPSKLRLIAGEIADVVRGVNLVADSVISGTEGNAGDREINQRQAGSPLMASDKPRCQAGHYTYHTDQQRNVEIAIRDNACRDSQGGRDKRRPPNAVACALRPPVGEARECRG